MEMWTIRFPFVFLVPIGLLAACGQPSNDVVETQASPSPTSGSEVATDELQRAPSQPPEPVVLRTTIPVPVPQPAVPRARLSEALQGVWTRVEEQVSNARPDGPEDATLENVQAWADGPFVAWVDERRGSLTEARDVIAEVPEEPQYERGLALALWAYAFEDMGAQIAGAPVPEEIAHDEELLGIYVQSLNDASVPLATQAVELYADCRRRLASLGDDSEWLPWRAYCVQRGQQVIEGYGLEERAVEE